MKKVIDKFAAAYAGARREISVAFVGDREIKKINKIYRGLDQTTDVLSFSGEDGSLGEIVLNPRQIKRQARRFNNSAERELAFILIHGLLHLVGYDDRTEKGRLRMIRRGEEFMKKLNM